MPIRPELRQFYRGPAWQAARRRILERAGGRFAADGRYLGGARCERCGKPDRARVWVWSNRRGEQYWTRALTVRSQGWIWCGHGAINFRLYSGSIRRDRASGRLRRIRVVLTIAHLNQTAGDDRDENMAALCQFCHLYHDRFQHAASARSNRRARKDRARPLLALLEAG